MSQKNAPDPGSPGALVSLRLKLEDDLQRELPYALRAGCAGRIHRSRAGAGRGDLPIGPRGHGGCRVGKIRMVEGVERLRLELRVNAALRDDVLKERQVDVVVARPPKIVSRCGAKGAHRILGEGRGVEPFLNFGYACRTFGAHAGNNVGEVVADAGVGVVDSAGDGERQTAL